MPKAAKKEQPMLQESIAQAADRIMDMVCERTMAVFVLGGKAVATAADGTVFEKHMKRHAERLVGVYNIGADYRAVKEDLACFA